MNSEKDELLKENSNEINILKWIYVVYKSKILIVSVFVLAIGIGLAACFLINEKYESSLTLVQNKTETKSGLVGGLGGLASSFGLSTNFSVNENEKYEDFIQSRNFAEKLSNEFFKLSDDSEPQPLHVLLGYKLDQNIPNLKRVKTSIIAAHMKRDFSIEIKKNGIIKMTTITPYANLSADLLNKIAELFDAFYRDYQGKKAMEMKKFVAKRAEDLEKKLIESENELKHFKEKNRTITQSPRLLLEMERLQRKITLDAKLYLTVKTELEMAKINEQKSIPILKVLDPAISDSQPKVPNKKVILLLSVAGGLALALIIVFIREYFKVLGPALKTILKKEDL